jgi:hypothetical protein
MPIGMEEKDKAVQKPRTLKDFLKSPGFLKTSIGIVLGGIAGFLYFYFIGCRTGSCPITANPLSSVAMGGLFGFLLSGSFDKAKKEDSK